MSWLNDLITDWLKEDLINAIMEKFQDMFGTINDKVGEIAGNIGQTPGAWHSGVFSMIRALSNTAILPIAGMILTFVVCYELIQMLIERNNMHDFDTFVIYKWIIKTFCAVYILTHTFDIVMGIFGLAQEVVNQSAGIITGSLDVNLNTTLADFRTRLEAMGIWELIGLYLESFFVGFCIEAMSILIFVISFGRMVEIYITISVAPIPLSTMVNREWGQIGNNYLKSLFALAFQGFLIMVCLAIYAALVQSIPAADNAHTAMWMTVGYTVLLCFSLLKSSSVAKSLFSAH